MKNFLKILAVVLAIGVGLFLVANLVLRVLLPPEKAKSKLLSQLTGRLHREVQVGSVSVGILSGISISDFKISEAPDFSKGTFLSTKHFDFHIALTPLLFRKVIVRQLVLRDPEVTVTRFADGKTFNFSDLTTSSPAAPSGGPAVAGGGHPPTPAGDDAKKGEPPFLLLVSNAEIHHGVLHFIDRSPANQSVDINPLDLKLRNVSLISPFTIQLSMNAKSHGTAAALDLAGDLDLRTATFKFRRCRLSSGKSLATLTGRASNLRSNQPTADLKLEVKSFDPAVLGPLVSLPPGTVLQGPLSGSSSLKGDRKRMDLSANLDFSKMLVKNGTTFLKPAGVPLLVSFNGQLSDLQNADIQSLGLSLGKIKVTGRGTVTGVTGAAPSAALHFQSNTFLIEELLQYVKAPLPVGTTARGPMEGSLDVSGTAGSNRLALKLQGDGADIRRTDVFHKAPGVLLRLALEGESLQPGGDPERNFNFQNISATLGSIEFKGAGTYKPQGASGQITFSGQGKSGPLQALAAMAPVAVPYRLSGNVLVDLRASGDVAAPVVNGTAQLDHVNLLYEKSELSGLTGTLRFTSQDLATDKLTGKLDGGDFTLRLAAHRLLTQPQYNLEASFAALDLDKLLAAPPQPRKQALLGLPLLYAAPAAPAAPPMDVIAHVTVGKLKHQLYQGQDFEFRCNLTSVTPDLARVSGTADLRQGPGKVLNVEKLVGASTTARLILFPLDMLQKIDRLGLLRKLGLPSLNDLPFKTLRGVYSFKAGVMSVQPFEMDGRDLMLQTQGTIGLAGLQPLNLNVLMRLAPGLLGGTLGQLIKDESGRATLRFSVTGPAADPKVKLEIQEATRKAAEELGRGLLKSLGLGGPQNTSSGGSTSPSSAAPAPDPVKELQKSLQNIFH